MNYDLFTIGAGSGGVRASRFAASMGAKVAIAEGRFFGGTCVNVGCVPKKLMVYASHFHDEFQDARGFGWHIEKPTFDWGAFLHKKDEEIKRLNHIYRRLLHNSNVTITEGYAKLIDANTVEVLHANGEKSTYHAKNILLATGGQPLRPTIPGAEHCLVSDDIFHLKALPRRIAIVGGGYIAIEFAGIFHGLGAEVSLVHRGERFLKGFDDELCRFLAKEMQKKGIAIHLNEAISHIDKHSEHLVAHLKNSSLDVDAIFYATGRTPHTAPLHLAAAGVQLGTQGEILVNDLYQTNVANIYAIGDVTNRVNLTPVALAEGMSVAHHLFGKKTFSVSYENIATAVFSQPPLATVGLSEEKSRELYGEIEVFVSEFTPLKHTLSGSTERTLMKLLVAKESRKVVGVHMVGADSPEIIQMAAVALQCNATKEQFDSTIGIHPTAAEEFVTMRSPRT